MSEKRNRIAINNCKEKLLKRDGNTCAVCGRTLDLSTCTIDHIYPRRFGGNDDFDNLQLLCAECNMLKSASSEIYEYQFESFSKNCYKGIRNTQTLGHYSKIQIQVWLSNM